MKNFALILLLMFSKVVAAQSTDKKIIRGMNYQTENDVFAGMFGLKNEDKDYTGGFKIELYTDYLQGGIFPLFKNRCNDDRNLNSIYFHGFGATPSREYFDLDTIVPEQRPYSAIVGFGWKRIATFDDRDSSFFYRSAIVSNLFVGKFGGNIPADVQNFLHQYVTNSAIVKGWDYQIANGKWAFSYNVKTLIHVFDFYKPKNGEPSPENKNWKDFLAPHLFISPQATVGNIFINGATTLSLTNRTAKSIATFTTISSNELSGALASGATKKNGKTKQHFFAHVGYDLYAKPYYILRNSMLTGLPYYDTSPYKLNQSQLNTFLFDAGVKLTYTYHPEHVNNNEKKRTTTAYLDLVYRSREFDFGDTHFYGGIGVTIFFL